MTQPRKPKTEQTPKGLTVPVPKRGEFFANLKKIAKPRPVEQTPTTRVGSIGKGGRRFPGRG